MRKKQIVLVKRKLHLEGISLLVISYCSISNKVSFLWLLACISSVLKMFGPFCFDILKVRKTPGLYVVLDNFDRFYRL